VAKVKLDKRDRAGLVCAVVAVGLVVFMACFCFLGPHKDFHKSRLKLAQLRAQEKLAFETRAEERQNLQRQEQLMERIRGREPRFDLGAFMSKVLRDAKLDERTDLQSVKPSSRFEHADNLSMVQLKLKGVSLADLVDLLHRIYASKNLVVLHKLDSIRPAPGNKGLDCNLTLIAPKA